MPRKKERQTASPFSSTISTIVSIQPYYLQDITRIGIGGLFWGIYQYSLTCECVCVPVTEAPDEPWLVYKSVHEASLVKPVAVTSSNDIIAVVRVR